MKQPLTRKQISLIHVAKVKLGMSEEEYRAFLSRFGVVSSLDLDARQFEEALRLMHGWGFERRGNGQVKMDPVQSTAGQADDGSRMIAKISRMLDQAGLPWKYADAMARRMFQVEKVKWLNAEQLHKVVAALTYRQIKLDKGKERAC